MKRVTRLEVFLVLDYHKKVLLRTIEIQGGAEYMTEIPRDDLRFYNHVAIHIKTNEEECL